jgi:hypothetical protein
MTATSEAPSPDANERFARIGLELADAVDAALRPWVERSILTTAQRLAGREALTNGLLADSVAAADAAHREVVPALRALVGTDAEAQRVNPLQLLRDAARHPTAVLAAHGIPPAQRDALQQETLPLDVYDIAPATWGDIDPSLVDPGIRWSAAKAYVVLDRRGRRSSGPQ